MKKVLTVLIILVLLQVILCANKTNINAKNIITDTSKVELVVQTGHNNFISNVLFYNNGKSFITGADNIKFWDTKTGLCFATIDGGGDLLMLNITETLLLCGGSYNEVCIVDLKTKQLLKKYKFDNRVISGDFIDDNNLIIGFRNINVDAEGNEERIANSKTLRVVNTKTDKVEELNESGEIGSVLYDTKNEIVIYNKLDMQSYKSKILFYDVKKKQISWESNIDVTFISKPKLENGKISFGGNTIDVEDKKVTNFSEGQNIEQTQFAKENNILCGSGSEIKMYDTKQKKFSSPYTGYPIEIGWLNNMAISKDGEYFITVCGNPEVGSNSMKLWSNNSKSIIKTYRTSNIAVTGIKQNKSENSIEANYVDFDNFKRYTRHWSLSDYTSTFSKEITEPEGLKDTLSKILIEDKLIVEKIIASPEIIIKNKTGNVITRLIDYGPNDYIIATPDNYYFTTKGAYNGVAFKKGNEMYSPEQFDMQYNRPDIVLERLGYASKEVIESYKKAYEKRLKKMNFKEEMFNKDFHLPEIKILNDNLATVVKDKVIKLDIKAWDTKYNLNRINVYNNDVPVYGVNGINLKDDNKSEYKENIKLNLLEGKNKIQVSVLNDKGVESLKKTVEISCEAEKSKPTLFVLAIGTSDYNDPKYKLTYAAKDANDLTELFKGKQGEYAEVKVMKLLDKDVTKENILKAKEFLMQTKVDDEVIVFIAGHGLLNKDFDYYYATCDIDFKNPEEKGITFDEIESLLDGIPALKKILFMDTCHSGEVDKEDIVAVEKQKEEKGEVTFRAVGDQEYQEKDKTKLGLKNTNQLLQELFVDLRRGSGAMVISSAGGMEFAWEGGDFKNGLFTYSLIDGLKNNKADINSDGTVTVSELRDYVSKRVEELTKGKQKPTMRRENIEFDFKVW
ncbi:MAG: caspase family protein [Ignavibacteriae bacterium]|nr:caspase family protein [Ignavibacteriota bacterium]